MRDCLSDTGNSKGTVIPSLRRGESDDVMIYGALGQLYTIGYPVDWNLLYKHEGRFVRLPSYQWQREYYWLESEESQQARQGNISVPVGPGLGPDLNQPDYRNQYPQK